MTVERPNLREDASAAALVSRATVVRTAVSEKIPILSRPESAPATLPRPRPAARPGEAAVAQWLGEFAGLRSRGDSASAQQLAAQGELKARIANYYAPLVESIARRFLNSGEPFDDLVQEGFLGLLSALENYDPGKNVKFSTYATHFVAGAIRHFLRDRGKVIKEPAWLHEVCTRLNRVNDALTQSLGRPPAAGEIARAMNLTEEAVEEILSTRQVFHVSALGSSSDGGDDAEMAGVVDPEKIRSDKYVTLQLPIEDRIVLENAVERLKALEQKVLFEFFYQDHNQTEIAKKLGISCNYVSHILKNSTKKLRRVIGEAEVTDRGRTREASIIDPASGVFTAEHLLARVDEELSRAARAAQPAALLYIELGNMPAVAGRGAGSGGDARLRREKVWEACGSALRRTLRRIDLAGRFDENSLLVFLPQMRGEAAAQVAVRMENVLLAAEALIGEAITVQVAAAFYPDQGRGTFDLIGAARRQALSERLMPRDADAPELGMKPPAAVPAAMPAAAS